MFECTMTRRLHRLGHSMLVSLLSRRRELHGRRNGENFFNLGGLHAARRKNAFMLRMLWDIVVYLFDYMSIMSPRVRI